MSTASGRRGSRGRGTRAVVPASSWADIDGPVHYLDYGGDPTGPLVVCVHGLGGSAINWAAVAPILTESARVVALDLAGFGRTRGGGRSTTVPANQRLLHRFLTEVLEVPAVLVGNSMGGLIGVLQAEAAPETVSALALVDPALPVGIRARPHPLVTALFAAYAVPAVGRTAMSRGRSLRSAEKAAMDVLRLCCADASRVPVDVVAAHVELARERREYLDIDAELIMAARSLLWVIGRRRRLDAILHGISVPVLLLHGDRDRLVPLAAARRVAAAHPQWRFEIARGVGHVPQLEDAPWTAGHILDWLGFV